MANLLRSIVASLGTLDRWGVDSDTFADPKLASTLVFGFLYRLFQILPVKNTMF